MFFGMVLPWLTMVNHMVNRGFTMVNYMVELPYPQKTGTGPLVRRSAIPKVYYIPKVRCVRGYNCLRFMDRLGKGSGGVVGCLGFRVGVSASYRYITSFGKLIHKLRHTNFGIVEDLRRLRNSGPSD